MCLPALLAKSSHFPFNHFMAGFLSICEESTLATNVISFPIVKGAKKRRVYQYTVCVFLNTKSLHFSLGHGSSIQLPEENCYTELIELYSRGGFEELWTLPLNFSLHPSVGLNTTTNLRRVEFEILTYLYRGTLRFLHKQTSDFRHLRLFSWDTYYMGSEKKC